MVTKFSVNNYVEKQEESNVKNAEVLLQCKGVQRVSLLIM